jgi:8-oxo-dGTP diphosphatase
MKEHLPPDLIVTCALIRQGNRLLCTQRSARMSLPLKWEFPGGKLEPGEDPADCIVREIEEELNLVIAVSGQAPEVRHARGNDSGLVLLPFLARVTSGNMVLLEHREARWCTPEEMPLLDWAPADVGIVDWWLETGQFLD